MSIINKTLKELDKRKNTSNIHEVYEAPSKRNSIQGTLLIVFIVCLTLCVLTLVYKIYFDKTITKETQVALIEPTVAPTVQDTSNAIIKEKKSESKQEDASNKQLIAETVKQSTEEIVVETKNELQLEHGTIENHKLDTIDYDLENYRIEDSVEQKPKSELTIKTKKLTASEEIDILFKKANNAITRGNKKEAIESLKNILGIDSKNTKAREKLASIYYGIGKNEEAIKLLDTGIKLQPHHSDYRLFLARIYNSLNQPTKGIKVLSQSNPPVSSNIDYYATLAQLAREDGDLLAAETAYEKLTSVSGKDGKWYLGLAIVCEKEGKTQKALSSYKKAVQLYLSNSSLKFAKQRIKGLEANND